MDTEFYYVCMETIIYRVFSRKTSVASILYIIILKILNYLNCFKLNRSKSIV